MASFKDYKFKKTVKLPLFAEEFLHIRQISASEFTQAAHGYHLERLELKAAGALTDEEDARLNLAMVWALVDSWSFDDELTLENFVDFLQSPDRSGMAAQWVQAIHRTADNSDSFIQKKPKPSSTGSELSGASTGKPEKKTRKQKGKL
jgi:hypothetical protein